MKIRVRVPMFGKIIAVKNVASDSLLPIHRRGFYHLPVGGGVPISFILICLCYFHGSIR